MLSPRAASTSTVDLDTGKIKEWRSIVTLIVFVSANVTVLFPFHIPIYVPRVLWAAILRIAGALRIVSTPSGTTRTRDGKTSTFVLFRFPMNLVTAPLVADLFLLAILAIGKDEVKGGIVGVNHIVPYDIMLFFFSLAYIAISIDASGLIRWLAFKVLQKGGKVGHRLFFYLYAFFFALTTFIGNDPVILSGTAFLSYMTRVSSNIKHPRAWIHTQFAVANIGSAILVSSNPTNLVLAGAFGITFIKYTANVIVPVFVTGIVLFPFLLYIIFHDESLVPASIKIEELPDELNNREPVNPNIPYAMGRGDITDPDFNDEEEEKKKSLEEVLNPFLDRKGAMFGAVIMAATLITVLVLNAVSQSSGEHPVFWVTLPAAVVMLCFDLAMGWLNRKETRRIARAGRQRSKTMDLERTEAQRQSTASMTQENADIDSSDKSNRSMPRADEKSERFPASSNEERGGLAQEPQQLEENVGGYAQPETERSREQTSLTSLLRKAYWWAQETFPTATTVFNHLPFVLVPFAFCMFILVQGLVTKGWVPVFAYGWDHWVNKTGTVGAIGGMGFVSVILCNFAGTNIGTTILICRVIQSWQEIHRRNGIPISERTFWGTVYSMAIGVNYGAFSLAFSASLAGLLWRDILSRKHIRISGLEFARVNLPIIAITMLVGLVVLTGEIYIVRADSPYDHA